MTQTGAKRNTGVVFMFYWINVSIPLLTQSQTFQDEPISSFSEAYVENLRISLHEISPRSSIEVPTVVYRFSSYLAPNTFVPRSAGQRVSRVTSMILLWSYCGLTVWFVTFWYVLCYPLTQSTPATVLSPITLSTSTACKVWLML